MDEITNADILLGINDQFSKAFEAMPELVEVVNTDPVVEKLLGMKLAAEGKVAAHVAAVMIKLIEQRQDKGHQ